MKKIIREYFLGIVSFILIFSFIFTPIGFILFSKWLGLESKGE